MSQELLQRIGQGDEAAAQDVFERYVERLTALARSRLSTRLQQRIDPDDVVMSAYRSFFLRARRGEFHLGEGRDLWHLLVEITLHKLYRQATHHTAQRRSTQRETADAVGTPPQVASREPSPEAAALLADELAAVLAELSPDARAAMELRLQGLELTEIAQSLGKSERTVRRWLDEAKAALRRRFPAGVAPAERKPRRTSQPKPLQLDFATPANRGRESLAEEVFGDGKSVSAQDSRPPNVIPHQDIAKLPFDDYRLLRQIGVGGSGKVYRAVIKPSATLVAIKFMKRTLLLRRELVERFVSEAKLVAQLDHPGIMRIHGVGHTPNRGYFLVMDLCEHGDLQRQLKAGPVALADALRWTTEAAAAIEYAHKHGIIHCDLKPSNLLIADDGHIVVTDFGLARVASEPSPDIIAGTPAFLAPEQLDARWGTIGPHTDVYGLGAVLYTLLAGHPPHTGSIANILDAIASGEEPAPLGIRVPEDVTAFVKLCLAAETDQRPKHLSALLASLHAKIRQDPSRPS